MSPTAPSLLARRAGAVVGLIAAVIPAGMLSMLLAAWSPASALTVATSCLGAGALIGATIGRGLAARPDPIGVLIVALIADIIGCLLASALILLAGGPQDSFGLILGSLAVLAIPGFFLLAFPGVVLGIVLARRLLPGRA